MTYLTRRGLAGLLGAALLAPPARLLAAPAAPIRVDPADVAFVDDLPPYQPSGPVSGRVRLWGHGSPKRDFIGGVVEAWISGFQRHQPQVSFENRLYGTASAIGALYTDAGDIALLGEEISPDAARAFRRARGYDPTGISVATGSVDADYFDYAHMIFVHRDNPLPALSLPQLEAIFGDEHRLSARNLRRWGDLGLRGAWAEKPIQPYNWKVDDDFALFFRERVLGGSHRWNPRTREYAHGKYPDGSQYDRGQRIVDAVGQDPFGIGVSNIRYATGQVRSLPLAWTDGGPAFAPTPANLIAQRYPLTRIIPAYVDRPPGRGVEPAAREFLRFALSREGQKALVTASAYLPLGPEARTAQLEKLS